MLKVRKRSTNRGRDELKILCRERNGVCLWQQRLERERFAWPRHLPAELISLDGHQINLLLAKRFRPSGEQISPDRLRLFTQAEHATDSVPAEEDDAGTVTVPEHQRAERGRKPLPEARVRVGHDLAEDHKTCGCGPTRSGEAVSEQLQLIPAQVRVSQQLRFTHACKGCEETINTATLPPRPILESRAAPGMLAHIAVAK